MKRGNETTPAADDDFAALLGASLEHDKGKRIRPGERVDGTVVQIGVDVVFVDIGLRTEAVIPRAELCDHDGALQVALGDRVRATVAQVGDTVRLVVALGRGSSKGTAALELAHESGAPVEGTVSRAVKGGVEVDIAGVRCFCPASHLDRVYTPDPAVYEGQVLRFLVLEIKDRGRSVIISRKALLKSEQEEMGRDRMGSLSVDTITEGTIASIHSYGAFVDLGGVTGLIHISELSNTRVGRVEDVVQRGETVRVKVLGVEMHEGESRIRLSMRALAQPDGPQASGKGGAARTVVDVTVVRVEPFGVVVQTESGTGVISLRDTGLMPGSDARRAFPAGKILRVVSLPAHDGRSRFSLRGVDDAEAQENYAAFSLTQPETAATDLGSLGEMLKAKLRGRG